MNGKKYTQWLNGELDPDTIAYEEEMKSIKWLDLQGEKSETIDTYMDTTAKSRTL